MSGSAGLRTNPLGIPADAPAAMQSGPPAPDGTAIVHRPAAPTARAVPDTFDTIAPPTEDIITSYISRAVLSATPIITTHIVKIDPACLDDVALDFLEYSKTQIFRDSSAGLANIPSDDDWKLYIKYAVHMRLDSIARGNSRLPATDRIAHTPLRLPGIFSKIINSIGSVLIENGYTRVVPICTDPPATATDFLRAKMTQDILNSVTSYLIFLEHTHTARIDVLSAHPAGSPFWLLKVRTSDRTADATIASNTISTTAKFPDGTPADHILAAIAVLKPRPTTPLVQRDLSTMYMIPDVIPLRRDCYHRI